MINSMVDEFELISSHLAVVWEFSESLQECERSGFHGAFSAPDRLEIEK